MLQSRWRHPHQCVFCVIRASILLQQVPGPLIRVLRVNQESILKSTEQSLSWIAFIVVLANSRPTCQLPREQCVKTAHLEHFPPLLERPLKLHVSYVQPASIHQSQELQPALYVKSVPLGSFLRRALNHVKLARKAHIPQNGPPHLRLTVCPVLLASTQQ
jgi:hypothetical protein